jgi:hypothetical protein
LGARALRAREADRSVAARRHAPHLAGVASGVLDTIQELGSVIGSAAIGALLQNRLAVSLAYLDGEIVALDGRGRPSFECSA